MKDITKEGPGTRGKAQQTYFTGKGPGGEPTRRGLIFLTAPKFNFGIVTV